MARGPTCSGKPCFQPLKKDESGVIDGLVQFRTMEGIGDEIGKFCGLGVGVICGRGWRILGACEKVRNESGKS